MTSTPGIDRGRSASVAGSVWASLRQGIWMMSFMPSDFSRVRSRHSADQAFDDAGPGDAARTFVAGFAETPRDALVADEGCERLTQRFGLRSRHVSAHA